MDIPTLAQYIKLKFAQTYYASNHAQANWVAEALEQHHLSGKLLLECTAKDLEDYGLNGPKLRYLLSVIKGE